MNKPRKILIASLGVAAVAYGCRREAVGNLMPAPAPPPDAQATPPHDTPDAAPKK